MVVLLTDINDQTHFTEIASQIVNTLEVPPEISRESFEDQYLWEFWSQLRNENTNSLASYVSRIAFYTSDRGIKIPIHWVVIRNSPIIEPNCLGHSNDNSGI